MDDYVWFVLVLCWIGSAASIAVMIRNGHVLQARLWFIEHRYSDYRLLPTYDQMLYAPKYWTLWSAKHWEAWIDRQHFTPYREA